MKELSQRRRPLYLDMEFVDIKFMEADGLTSGVDRVMPTNSCIQTGPAPSFLTACGLL